MADRIRQVRAKVVQVVTPDAVDARIHLGFGVHVDKRLHIADAPMPSQALWGKARECLIYLVGGKNLIVLCDTTVAHPTVPQCVLHVPVQHAPETMMDVIDGKTHLIVGAYMRYLGEHGFDIDVIRRELGKV